MQKCLEKSSGDAPFEKATKDLQSKCKVLKTEQDIEKVPSKHLL
jgi:hypothetical protein